MSHEVQLDSLGDLSGSGRSAVTHPGRLEERPDIRASLAASRADEPILNVGNPDVIGPLARVHLDRVAALVIGAIEQDVIDAGLAHFSESDFLLTGVHVPHDSADRG